MRIELDHLFVCTAPGAPEAEELVRFGLREGPPNRHLGQGTANRRFAFANAMIELLWVSDPKEAQNECSRRTLLWERWSGRAAQACPFGICVRPVDPQNTESPFPAWEYRPAYLPDPLVMHIGESSVEEPMWVYLGFMRRVNREQQFAQHPIGMREITGLTLITPTPPLSTASQRMIESGILSTEKGSNPLLEIEFDGHRRKEIVDFSPHLPLVFQL
jgi:Glyoxalase-like domain